MILRILFLFILIPKLIFSQCQINLVNYSDITCYGGNDGFIEVSGSNGTGGGYHYSLQIFNNTTGLWQQIGQSPLGNNFTLLNVTFTALTAQCYQIVVDDPSGCTDTLQICLNSPPLSFSTNTVNACESYLWNGINYVTSGVYDSVFTNINGCDSTATLNLTINNNNSGSATVTSCDTYLWEGITYNSSGVYTNVLTNVDGCDSTANLDLTIYYSDTIINQVITCDSYIWNGITYSVSGTYDSLFTNIRGCDSLVILDLTINSSDTSFFQVTSCDSYTWLGNTYTSSGYYDTVLTTTEGCDSLVILDLVIYNSYLIYDTITSCDSFNFNGTQYFMSGSYFDTLSSINGCDSIISLELTINQSYQYIDTVTTCDSYVFSYYNGLIYDSSGVYSDTLISSLGCDSIITLVLTINYSYSDYQNITSCFSFDWYDTTFYVSGIYDTLFTDFNGCDSLISVGLTIANNTSSIDTVVACNSYFWNGNTYTTSGFYDSLFTNSQGCDSMAILILTINQSDSLFNQVNTCDSYIWNGITYGFSGTYDSLFTNINGCDSLVTLNLTINNSDTSILNIISCDSYIWNGTTYSISGSYDSLFTNINGCDSLAILNLTINSSDTSITNITHCGSYVWNGIIYSSSGVYDSLFTNSQGCDSLAIIDLTIFPNNIYTVIDTACDFYNWDGISYDSSGLYTTTFSDSNGCDSTINLYLTILISGCMDPFALNYDSLAGCSTACLYPECNISLIDSQNITCFGGNDGYIQVGGTGGNGLYNYSIQIYNLSSSSWQQIGQSPISGGYTYSNVTFSSLSEDCYKIVITDSLACNDTLDVCLSQPAQIIVYDSLISCDSYIWNGVTYDSSGIYIDTLSNLFGCDSIVTLDLTILNSSSSFEVTNSCDSYTWNGITYFANGVYDSLFVNSQGCDSLAMLILTLNGSDTSIIQVNSCNSYTWLGNNYAYTGLYDSLYTNINGCDSLVVLDLTINYSDTISTSVIVCDSYAWLGNTYSVSGVYDSLLTNINGCDSLVILDLTINNSDTTISQVTSCDSYTWLGNTYFVSGFYDSLFTNINGCDSLVVLDLTINHSDTSIIQVTACDTFTWLGNTYSFSGVYDSLFTNIQGCDSLVVLNLIIKISDTTITQVSACDSYTWLGNTYLFSGVYDSLLINMYGCDSLATIDLTINNSVNNSISDTSCDTYIWDGISYNATGQYTNIYTSSNGCDSIVTLDLFILYSSTSSSIITSCISYEWNGITYTSSGLYDSLFVNSVGCDSLAQIYLTIVQPIITNINVEACGIYSFAGVTCDSSGIYTDSLIAITGCDSIVILDLTISDNLSAAAIVNDVLCNGDSTGFIDINVGLGIPPYTYQWSNSATTQDIYQLFGDSTYSCLITDSFGCYIDTFFYISQPNPLFVNTTVTNILCFGDSTGSINLNISGGTSPYFVNWGSLDTNNLFAGIYNYSILDSNGCILNDYVEVIEEDEILFSLNSQNIQCFGDSTGFVEVTMQLNSGLPPYQFLWNGPASYTSTFEDVYSLVAGVYTLTITDANSCFVDTTIELSQPLFITQNNNYLTSDYNNFEISCSDFNDGWIELDITGGYAPFTYLWSNQSTNDSIFDLSAGLYSVTITDSLGCLSDIQIVLEEPQKLDAIGSVTSSFSGYSVSCYAENDGSVSVNPSGGVMPYSIYWESTLAASNFTIWTIDSLVAGIYSLEVIDANYCQFRDTITLIQPDSLSMTIVELTDTCNRAVGQTSVNVIGGVTPYSFSWSNGVSSSVNDDLIEGEYFVTVLDNNSCEISDSIIIGNIPNPMIDFRILSEWEKLYEQLDDPITFIDITNLNGHEIVSWQWDFGDGYSDYDSVTYHSYLDTGTYNVTLVITTLFNCLDTLSKQVKITDYNIFIPNAFTPFSANDELNNIFKAYGSGIEEFEMIIFNRGGEQIFKSNSIDDGWDGTSIDKNQVPIGIYMYTIDLVNIYGQDYKYSGQVKLIR